MSLISFLNFNDLTDHITGQEYELTDHLIVKTQCYKCNGSGVSGENYYSTIDPTTKLHEVVCSECKGQKYIAKAIELIDLENALRTWIISEITTNGTELREIIRKLLIDTVIDS